MAVAKSLASAAALATFLAAGLVASDAMHLTWRSEYFLTDLGADLLVVMMQTLVAALVVALPVGVAIRSVREQAFVLSAFAYVAVSVKVFALDADLFGNHGIVVVFLLFSAALMTSVWLVARRLKLSTAFPMFVALAFANATLGIASGWALAGGRLTAFLLSGRTIAVASVTALVLLGVTALQQWVENRAHRWRHTVGLAVVLGLVVVTLAYKKELPSSRARVHSDAEHVDIYVLSFDALRADMLQAFIATKPDGHLAALARQSLVFENVIAPGPNTDASLARNTFLSSDYTSCATSVPAMLSSRGYYTAMLFANGGRRFEGSVCYEYFFAGDGASLVDRFIVPALRRAMFTKYGMGERALPAPRLLEQLEKVVGSPAPVFAYLHFLELHAPYMPRSKLNDAGYLQALERYMRECYAVACDPASPEYAGLVGTARAAYVEILDEVDHSVARALEIIRSRGRDFVLVVTADHGELFGEHGGYGHSGGFVPELLHVPFVVYDSRRPQRGTRCELTLANEALAETVGLGRVTDREKLEFAAPPLGHVVIDRSRQVLQYWLDDEVLPHAGTWRNIHRSRAGTVDYAVTRCNAGPN